MIDKLKLIEEICKKLERELTTHFNAAQEAKEAATHEEAKAENKYDTRGLEASYLAAGQAKRVEEIGQILGLLKSAKPKDYNKDTPIGVYALVELDIEEIGSRLYFLVPKQGGDKIEIDSLEVTTLSLEAPLGRKVIGRRVSDYFEFKAHGENREYEIINCW